MDCKICGARGASYRSRSRMTLCESCHETTPEKATYAEFLAVTEMPSDGIAREFYDDYKTSDAGDVAAYWRSCSAA